MGVDLKALATHFRERCGEFLPTAILRFDRDAGLFAQLARDAVPCLVHPLPAALKVGCYEDTGLTYETADRNGDPLTFATPPTCGASVFRTTSRSGTVRSSLF